MLQVLHTGTWAMCFRALAMFLFIFHHIQLKKNQLNYTLTFALIDPLQGAGRDEASWRKAVLTQKVNEERRGNWGRLALLFCRGLEGKSPQGPTVSALEPP